MKRRTWRSTDAYLDPFIDAFTAQPQTPNLSHAGNEPYSSFGPRMVCTPASTAYTVSINMTIRWRCVNNNRRGWPRSGWCFSLPGKVYTRQCIDWLRREPLPKLSPSAPGRRRGRRRPVRQDVVRCLCCCTFPDTGTWREPECSIVERPWAATSCRSLTEPRVHNKIFQNVISLLTSSRQADNQLPLEVSVWILLNCSFFPDDF